MEGVGMDVIESAERQLLRESVAKVAAAYGHEYWLDCSRAGRFTEELWRELARPGFVGPNLPEEHGGGGMGLAELAVVIEELAAAGMPSLMHVLSPGIVGSVLVRHGTEEQQRGWLPGIASGERRVVFAITEPDAGSNSHNLTTTATPHRGGWRIRGTKHYISGVDAADALLVVVRTGRDDVTGRARLSLFLVDAGAPGLQRSLIPVEVTAPERQYTLFFDDVEVGPDRLVGAEGDGLRLAFTGLNPERITIAALCNGIGRYALSRAAAYARERQVWDVPIGAHQGIAHPLAEAKIGVELARLMTAKAAALFDGGHDAGEASNMAKFAAAEACLAALDQAVQTHGGNGMATEYGLSTLWGMARLMRIAPVSREMILNYVAQRSLGLPRSY